MMDKYYLFTFYIIALLRRSLGRNHFIASYDFFASCCAFDNNVTWLDVDPIEYGVWGECGNWTRALFVVGEAGGWRAEELPLPSAGSVSGGGSIPTRCHEMFQAVPPQSGQTCKQGRKYIFLMFFFINPSFNQVKGSLRFKISFPREI